MEKNFIGVFAQTIYKIRAASIIAEARPLLEYWAMGPKNNFIFYNRETGEPFVDMKAGLELLGERRNRECKVACNASHVCGW